MLVLILMSSSGHFTVQVFFLKKKECNKFLLHLYMILKEIDNLNRMQVIFTLPTSYHK